MATRVLRVLNECFGSVYHTADVLEPCPIPPTGPGILVCNHTSYLDPIFLQAACPRLVRWMMASEYYDLPILGKVFRTIGVIPVERSGRDLAATREALRVLERGEVLGIFPEGKIEPDNRLLEFQSGIGLLSRKSRAPVYPAYIIGSQRGKSLGEAYLTRQHATLLFGPPLDRLRSARTSTQETAIDIQQAVEWLRLRVLGLH